MRPCARISSRCVVPRIYKPAPTRSVFTTPFFPHFSNHPLTSDLAPLFRLLDTVTNDLVPSSSSSAAPTTTTTTRHLAAPRTFTPRFDVREVDASYELKGELPGIEQRDLEIEFVDERTLVIRGKTAVESTTTTATSDEAVTAVVADEETAAASDDSASEKSVNYRKPSVADDEYVDVGAESAKAPSSPATADVAPSAVETKKAEPAPNSRYWISERAVGEFERRFSFPGKVDQDAVKASLRNGILSIVVPKVVAREARRITIE